MSSVLEARNRHRKTLSKANRAAETKQFEKAERLYLSYIKDCPTDPQVLFNLGVLVQRRADNAADRHLAGSFYQRCFSSPEVDTFTKSNAMNNFGLIMGKINEVEKAGICFGLALKMNPGNHAARINFADILRHDGQYEAADKEFAAVLRHDPNSAPAKFSAGMIALMLGDMKRGWELYEGRFETDAFPSKRLDSKKPLWRGEDLSGKTLLITSEQGLGDDLQFVRYAREVKQRWPDCKVWFGGGPLMKNIMTGVEGLDLFTEVKPGDQLFDYHCPSMSMPYRMGTTLETIQSAPYIFPVQSWAQYVLPEK